MTINEVVGIENHYIVELLVVDLFHGKLQCLGLRTLFKLGDEEMDGTGAQCLVGLLANKVGDDGELIILLRIGLFQEMIYRMQYHVLLMIGWDENKKSRSFCHLGR